MSSSSKQHDKVSVPWDKVIDKKVKSSDDKDLGKVKSIASLFIEADEGVISKKRYFIPKYYIESFDGDDVHASLTKDEVKSKYERDSPPSETELQTQYLEQKQKEESGNQQQQLVHGVPFMARESGVVTQSDVTGEEAKIEWAEVIHKRVMAADDIDIGDVERVGKEFIVVRQGVAKVHLYYIPKACIINYDGSSLYVNVPSDFVRAKFERQKEPTAEEIQALTKEAKEHEEKARRHAKKQQDEDKSMPGRKAEHTTGRFEEGAPGTEAERKDDPLTSYREKEPMTPAKIKEHEPTAVKRDPNDQRIVDPGQTGTNSEEAAEIARKKGMAKGTAGAAETGSKSEQSAAGTNE
jgi:hypothetical protein